MHRIILACVAAISLAACQAKAPAPAGPPAVAAAPNAATLTAATITPTDLEQPAAAVNKVVALERGDAKLFSTVGGDPAINGEYVFLALIGDPHEGWKIFQIGDFNSWELVEQSPDRAVLKVSHSAVEQATGEIVTYEQKIAVTVPAFEATQVDLKPVE